MIKDHLKSKKHLKKKDLKEAGCSGSGIRQVSLTTITKSKNLREEFVLDFIKMSTMADIPLEKVEKMSIEILQAGRHTTSSFHLEISVHSQSIRSPLYSSQAVAEALVDLIADETTDCRDKSILNVIATIRGKCYLIGIAKMDACNHSTFSQEIVKCVSGVEIPFDRVRAVVTDSAAYCKKAYREILSPLFPKSTYVLCLAHIVNLASEVF